MDDKIKEPFHYKLPELFKSLSLIMSILGQTKELWFYIRGDSLAPIRGELIKKGIEKGYLFKQFRFF
jgi:hypothetical protein